MALVLSGVTLSGARTVLRPFRLIVALGVAAMALAGQSPVRAQTQTALPLKHTPQPTHGKISAEDLMTRLYIFADDSMEGRVFQTAGNVRATNYIAAELKKLKLEPAGDSGTYFQALPFDSVQGGNTRGRNVVAILRGTDPKLNHTYVAIGAHNDHTRFREPVDHDSLRAWNFAIRRADRDGPEAADRAARTLVINVDSLHRLHPARLDSIRNGADDDGSGTVAVLEVAEALAKLPAKPKRSILFVFHTGEEEGMFGSEYFLAHPTVPRDSIITQVNLDMIGRGSAEDTPEGGPNMLMVVGASRLSSELGQIVKDVNTSKGHGLRLDYTWDAPGHPAAIYTRSDHYAYAKRGIPVVFFFTGLHADYHQVTDEPQYIDYQHLTKNTSYIYDLVLRLGSLPKRPVIDHPVPQTP